MQDDIPTGKHHVMPFMNCERCSVFQQCTVLRRHDRDGDVVTERWFCTHCHRVVINNIIDNQRFIEGEFAKPKELRWRR